MTLAKISKSPLPMFLRAFPVAFALSIFAFANSAKAQFAGIAEDFSTTGNLAGTTADTASGSWASISGSGGPVVSSGALSIAAASGDAAQLNFSATNLSVGTIYFGFDFTVSSSGSLGTSGTISAFTGFRSGTASTGSNALGFGAFRPTGDAQSVSGLSSTSTSQFYAGLFGGSGHNATSSPLTAWSAPLDRGTRYRAVIGFDLSNDLAQLWIDPSSSSSSSITLTALTSSPRGIFVREGAASHGSVTLDNFNVAQDFDTAAGLSAIPEPSTYAAIFGGIALISAAIHRRRRTRLESPKA
jgi:hypothetical protein